MLLRPVTNASAGSFCIEASQTIDRCITLPQTTSNWEKQEKSLSFAHTRRTLRQTRGKQYPRQLWPIRNRLTLAARHSFPCWCGSHLSSYTQKSFRCADSNYIETRAWGWRILLGQKHLCASLKLAKRNQTIMGIKCAAIVRLWQTGMGYKFQQCITIIRIANRKYSDIVALHFVGDDFSM